MARKSQTQTQAQSESTTQRKRQSRKKVETPVQEPEPETPVQEPETETHEEENTEETSVLNDLDRILGHVEDVYKALKAISTEIRTAKKKAKLELKRVAKGKRKPKDPNAKRQQTGFDKPTLLTEKLHNFLKNHATCYFEKTDKKHENPIHVEETPMELPRTNVNKRIHAYIVTNNLQHKENGRFFDVDGPLGELLGKPLYLRDPNDAESGIGYSYFNLQSYMKPLYPPKKVVPKKKRKTKAQLAAEVEAENNESTTPTQAEAEPEPEVEAAAPVTKGRRKRTEEKSPKKARKTKKRNRVKSDAESGSD